jgi:penicillin amidase
MANRKTILMQLLRGEMMIDQAADELGISRQSVRAFQMRYLRGKVPKTRETFNAPVDQPVTVLRDQWGVAHIDAASVADCFTVLGYAMAQDRLWQMDYMRRLAHGQLSEVLGADYLAEDRLHRTIGLTRAAQSASSVMSDEVRMVLQSLAGGINAWMGEMGDRRALEFELLDYEPMPWTVVDSIAIWKWRWWMLTGRLGVIALNEAAKRHLSPDLLDLFLTIEAGEETIVPSAEPARIGGYDTGIGSNNWVVGGGRTEKGQPVLATDPHNNVSLCRQWYQAQVTAPGMDAIGAFFLGTPGIYLGHTRHTSWGVTNHTASVRDLYVEEVSSEDANLYREGDEWRSFEVDRQEIPVRGESDDLLVISRTVRGPVVNAFVSAVDDGEQPVLTMRWVGSEPTTGFEAMLALMRSQNVDEVLEALAQWPMPILNFAFADSHGRFGYHAVGHVPTRKAINYGFRPANDPDHEWGSPYAFEDLPHLVDPECNWVATANNSPWGGRGDYLALGGWSEGYRFRRIKERIEALEIHTLESVGAIQADAVHGRGQDLAAIVAEVALKARNRRLRELGELLRDWDGAYSVDSVAASVFTAFWEHWVRRVMAAQFPQGVVALVAARGGSVARRVLTGDAAGWMPSGVDVEREVRETLVDVLSWLRRRVGTRKSQWRWGRLHTVTFRHPLGDGGVLSKVFDVGPFESAGSTGTVRAAGYSFGNPFEVTGLSTYRMVVDMADPAHGKATTAGGQSGHPGSPNYRTQSELWAADDYHPLLMDRADVEANLESSLTLEPGS